MKTKIFIIILFATINVFSQVNIDPPKLNCSFSDTCVYDRNFNQKKYLIGMNWGNEGRKLDEALSVNYSHRFFNEGWDGHNKEIFTSSRLFKPDTRYAICFDHMLHGLSGNDDAFNGRAQLISPLLNVATNEFDFNL